MNIKEKRKYQVREEVCYKRECFVPFNGNGIKICRLYELGQCPKKYTQIFCKCPQGSLCEFFAKDEECMYGKI